MSHQTKRPFDSVECFTPHYLLIRCSLSNLQFPAIALTWCGLTSHRHRSIEPFFMSLAARDSEFRRWSARDDRRICQTFAASPAEPGELPLGFRTAIFRYRSDTGVDPEKLSVISHSFGTYVVSQILQNQEFAWYRVIFCGSVVRNDFDFDAIFRQFRAPLLNDVGT